MTNELVSRIEIIIKTQVLRDYNSAIAILDYNQVQPVIC